MAENSELFDKFNRLLAKGNCVAFSHHNELKIGVITKVCPVMISISELGGRPQLYRKYPTEMVIVDGPEVTMYCLRNGK
jgi:hypothetical protein